MKSAPDKKVYASFFERNTDYTDTRVILPVTSSASLVGLTKGQPGEVINLRSNGITRPEGALVGLVAGLALSQADELTGQGVMYSVTAVASS